MDPDQRALAGAEATHHGGAGHVPRTVATCRHGYGDRGEHDGNKRGQPEETPRAIERGADLGARVGRGFELLAAIEAGTHAVGEVLVVGHGGTIPPRVAGGQGPVSRCSGRRWGQRAVAPMSRLLTQPCTGCGYPVR